MRIATLLVSSVLIALQPLMTVQIPCSMTGSGTSPVGCDVAHPDALRVRGGQRAGGGAEQREVLEAATDASTRLATAV